MFCAEFLDWIRFVSPAVYYNKGEGKLKFFLVLVFLYFYKIIRRNELAMRYFYVTKMAAAKEFFFVMG